MAENNRFPNALENLRFQSAPKFNKLFRHQHTPDHIGNLGFTDFIREGIYEPLMLVYKGNIGGAYDKQVDVYNTWRPKQKDYMSIPNPVPCLAELEVQQSPDYEAFRQHHAELLEDYDLYAARLSLPSDVKKYLNGDLVDRAMNLDAGYRLYGKGKHHRSNKPMRRGVKSLLRRDKYAVKKEASFAEARSGEDAKKVLDLTVNHANTVCVLSNDDVLPVVVASHVGKMGKTFVGGEGNIQERLFQKFLAALVDYDYMKENPGITDGAEYLGLLQQQRGDQKQEESATDKIRWWFKAGAGSYLMAKYNQAELAMQSGQLDETQLQDFFYEIARKFYYHWNVRPVSGGVTDVTSVLYDRTFNTVIMDGKFGSVPDHRKEEALWSMDKALMQGGYLVMHEHVDEQALADYYGQEVFRGYEKVDLEKRVKATFPNHWTVLQKK